MLDALTNLRDFFLAYGDYWASWSPDLERAVVVTIEITLGSFVLGMLIGVGTAMARIGGNPWLRGVAITYVELSRGIPALAILFLVYFGLVPLGIALNAVVAAIVGLGLSSGGYFAEIIRAGIQATHRGQREAGLAIGMSPVNIYRFIIMPQALRIALPPLVNMLVALLKDSSLASLISAPEIMLRARDIAAADFLPLNIFLLAGAIYLVMAIPLTWGGRVLERRLRTGLSTNRL